MSALCAGGIFYGVGLYWLLLFDPKIYILAFLFVAPVFAFYFLILSFVSSKTKSDSASILMAAASWALIQKIYALSPISTIAIEVPFYGTLPFFQIASVTGFVAVPVCIMGLNASISLFLKGKTRGSIAWMLVFIGLLGGIWFWGSRQLLPVQVHTRPKIAVIQHNFPVSGKWRLDHPVYIRAEYRRLALEAANQKPDMIIFPLYSFPDDILRNPEFFTGLARETNAWILVASYIPQKKDASITQGFFDAALLYSPEGKLTDHYQAVQAPPFREISEFTNNQYKILESPFGKLGILLCYEDSLPGMARKAVHAGAEILIALSNPGHFTSTHMPYYHLMQDRLRAIESNRWLIRASANGYSALIDPKGRFVQKSELHTAQTLFMSPGREQVETWNHRTMDLFTLTVVLIFVLVVLWDRYRPTTNKSSFKVLE